MDLVTFTEGIVIGKLNILFNDLGTSNIILKIHYEGKVLGNYQLVSASMFVSGQRWERGIMTLPIPGVTNTPDRNHGRKRIICHTPIFEVYH